MTTYMEKYPRRNGVAAKKPGFWKRLIKGIIPWKGDSAAAVIRKLVLNLCNSRPLCDSETTRTK